jgi:hypothetical protein
MNISNENIDTLLNAVVIIVFLICFIGVIILIYKLFVEEDYNKLRIEGFTGKTFVDRSSTVTYTTTIYETSINDMYTNNPRLICSVVATSGKDVCIVNDVPYVIYKFPVHLIKLINGSILAVFNDGRLYQKDSILSTMWRGPIDNSLPNNIVPLRMVTLASDLVTLLGVGYDNKLYMKAPTDNGNINLEGIWKQVPNNADVIYVLYDRETNFLITINTQGKLFIKPSEDLTNDNIELLNKLDRPILRLYYDLNGYMLAIDNKFDMYEFIDKDWKNSPLNIKRGPNSSKIHDILYNNDGKMFALVFNPDAFMVQIMKQAEVFYLADFAPLDIQLSLETSTDFVMSDQDIIKSKTGSIKDYINNMELNESTDDDPNFAYQKQMLETQAQLRDFCAKRGNSVASNNYDNYDMLTSVEENVTKINKLKNVITNLMAYEPDRMRLQEKYPVILRK